MTKTTQKVEFVVEHPTQEYAFIEDEFISNDIEQEKVLHKRVLDSIKNFLFEP